MRNLNIKTVLLLACLAVVTFTGSSMRAPEARPAGAVIDQFLAMLNGTEAAAEAAVKKFCTPEVIANGMIPYGKDPKITKREGNCVVAVLNWEGEKMEYHICEENGKINVFELYFDEEE